MSEHDGLLRKLKEAQIRVDVGAQRLIDLADAISKKDLCGNDYEQSCRTLRSCCDSQVLMDIQLGVLVATYETSLLMLRLTMPDGRD
jgi:hypothetical protein